MGDLVPLDGKPDKPGGGGGPTDGQALFTAIVDVGVASGVNWPRSAIAMAVRQGAECIRDGIDLDLVLTACLAALRRGQPQFTSRIVLDFVNHEAGIAMGREEYEGELERSRSMRRTKELIAETRRRRLQRGKQ